MCLGTVVSGRSHAAATDLIGHFVNTVVLRLNTPADTSFTDALARVHTTALDAFAHSELPFSILVDAMRPDRSHGGNPLFNVMFSSFHFADLPSLAAGEVGEVDVRWIHRYPEVSVSQFDLSLEVADSGAEVTIDFEFDTAILDGAAVRGWLCDLEELLRQVASAADACGVSSVDADHDLRGTEARCMP